MKINPHIIDGINPKAEELDCIGFIPIVPNDFLERVRVYVREFQEKFKRAKKLVGRHRVPLLSWYHDKYDMTYQLYGCVPCGHTQGEGFSCHEPIKGIKEVRLSRGKFIPTGVGPSDRNFVTYQEFFESDSKKIIDKLKK